jgi:hypothetical protein
MTRDRQRASILLPKARLLLCLTVPKLHPLVLLIPVALTMQISMDHWRYDTDVGKTEAIVETAVTVPLCSPQISNGLTWDRTRAFAITSSRPTDCAMARSESDFHKNYVWDFRSYRTENTAHLQNKCCSVKLTFKLCQNAIQYDRTPQGGQSKTIIID